MDISTDVVVIGGGAAGVAAASSLAKAGIKVCLLEAKPRLGGRIHTLTDCACPAPAELGASFIHGNPQSLESLLPNAGLEVFDVEPDHWGYLDWHLRQENPDLSPLMSWIRDRPEDLSFDEAVRIFGAQNERTARTLAKALFAADTKRVSAKAVADIFFAWNVAGGFRNRRLKGGYDHLIRTLAIELPPDAVFLNTTVTEVRWADGGVELRAQCKTDELTVRGKKAIVTLPLAILQECFQNDPPVLFSPRLEAKEKPLSELACGSVTKLILSFDREPLAQAEEQPREPVASPFQVWWDLRPSKIPMITLWAGGPPARELAEKDDEDILQTGLTALAATEDLSLHTLESRLVCWHIGHWDDDLTIGLAYSYETVNATNAHEQLAQPLDDTLFFAGEATHTGGRDGTVDGAIETGWQAAKATKASLKLN